jgi:uncharacterized protein YdeI (YjbR/CyaY-like superfamily)
MPTKPDPRLDAYIAEAAPFAQPILRHLRALVHRGCPDVVEGLKWSHPGFTYQGAILCNMAAFKAHAAFGFWHQGMKAVLAKDGVAGEDAMGSLGRLTSLKDLPSDATLLRYIKTAAQLIASGEKSRPAPKPKAASPVPADLAAALKTNKAAAATFEKFPPSHRREYIEWITEAKREETRAKRVATTLEWLAEGKQRNWKYMNC